jgi:hypothetical protein
MGWMGKIGFNLSVVWCEKGGRWYSDSDRGAVGYEL